MQGQLYVSGSGHSKGSGLLPGSHSHQGRAAELEVYGAGGDGVLPLPILPVMVRRPGQLSI